MSKKEEILKKYTEEQREIIEKFLSEFFTGRGGVPVEGSLRQRAKKLGISRQALAAREKRAREKQAKDI